MKNEPPLPYDSFPSLSKDFVDEMHWRSMTSLGAMRVFDFFGKKEEQKHTEVRNTEVRNMAFHFALSQIATLIDGRGKLSIKI